MNDNMVVPKKLLVLLMVLSGVALLVAVGALMIAKTQPTAAALSLTAHAGGCCTYTALMSEPEETSLDSDRIQQTTKSLKPALKLPRLGAYDASLVCGQATSCQ